MHKWLKVSACAWIMLLAAGTQAASAPNNESAVRQFLTRFITSFNNLDWEQFRNCFDDDASVIHPAQFPRRLDGQANYEPAWRKIFADTRIESGRSRAPFMTLQPQDVRIQLVSEVAVVSFHLNRGVSSLGRRTLVLHRTAAGWKIIHLHASNVQLDTTSP